MTAFQMRRSRRNSERSFDLFGFAQGRTFAQVDNNGRSLALLAAADDADVDQCRGFGRHFFNQPEYLWGDKAIVARTSADPNLDG
jgi:hypothetical protein